MGITRQVESLCRPRKDQNVPRGRESVNKNIPKLKITVLSEESGKWNTKVETAAAELEGQWEAPRFWTAGRRMQQSS
jgi:hypothetical protein